MDSKSSLQSFPFFENLKVRFRISERSTFLISGKDGGLGDIFSERWIQFTAFLIDSLGFTPAGRNWILKIHNATLCEIVFFVVIVCTHWWLAHWWFHLFLYETFLSIAQCDYLNVITLFVWRTPLSGSQWSSLDFMKFAGFSANRFCLLGLNMS